MTESSTWSERLAIVRQRVDEACRKAGRHPEEVHILPVAKTFGPDDVAEAAACGFDVIGENRVQEARQKIPLCPGHLKWHLVGHLQTNKAREAVRLFEMIHSIDSERLLEFIDRAAGDEGRASVPVLLEVNVAGEATKHGLAPEDVEPVLLSANRFFHVQVRGLMAVPPAVRDPEDARPWFKALRELRDSLQDKTGFQLPELSMGMSGDYPVAVEEGATWIRLGSILFGTRSRPLQEGEE